MDIKNEIDILRWIDIVEEEINLKYDRALVITSASILETQLEKILKCFMLSDNKIDERLFTNNAPLATFSSKNSMCYYIGIISEYEYKTIETIRKIRNKFAHEIEIKKMSDSQSIIDLCNNLTIPKELYIQEELVFEQNGKLKSMEKEPLKNVDIQTKFIKVFKNLTMYLEYRTIEIYEMKRIEYKNVSYIQMMKDSKEKLIKLSKKLYDTELYYKSKLMLELDRLNKTNSERTKIEEKKKEIQEIDDKIKAYEDGHLFYNTIIEKVCDSQMFIDIMEKSIEANEED